MYTNGRYLDTLYNTNPPNRNIVIDMMLGELFSNFLVVTSPNKIVAKIILNVNIWCLETQYGSYLWRVIGEGV